MRGSQTSLFSTGAKGRSGQGRLSASSTRCHTQSRFSGSIPKQTKPPLNCGLPGTRRHAGIHTMSCHVSSFVTGLRHSFHSHSVYDQAEAQYVTSPPPWIPSWPTRADTVLFRVIPRPCAKGRKRSAQRRASTFNTTVAARPRPLSAGPSLHVVMRTAAGPHRRCWKR